MKAKNKMAERATMPFIVSSSADKADPATRRLIRSHVMRGKKQNRVRPSKRRLEAEKRERCKSSHVARAAAVPIAADEGLRVELVSRYAAPVPLRVGSDFSFVEFADEVESEMVFNVMRFASIGTPIIFPLLSLVGFRGPSEPDRFFPIASDAPLLHITTYTVECFIDRVLRGGDAEEENATARLHFQRGVALLRRRLVDGREEDRLSDVTVTAVVKLASAAHFNGLAGEARRHMLGLRRMVELRGGIGGLRAIGIWFEMVRCDLGIAMLDGGDPVFFGDAPPPYPETFVPHEASLTAASTTALLSQVEDSDLVTVWHVMRRFCLVADLATQTQKALRPELIGDTMAAVMYRLLRTRYAAGSLDEAVRCGLLAFAYHVFLQWKDIRPPYRRFSEAYKSCVGGLEDAESPPQLILWLWFVGALAFWDVSQEPWLRLTLRKHAGRRGLRKWKHVLAALKEVAWLPALDDGAGRRICELLDLGRPC